MCSYHAASELGGDKAATGTVFSIESVLFRTCNVNNRKDWTNFRIFHLGARRSRVCGHIKPAEGGRQVARPRPARVPTAAHVFS